MFPMLFVSRKNFSPGYCAGLHIVRSFQILSVLVSKPNASKYFAQQLGWQEAIVRLLILRPRPISKRGSQISYDHPSTNQEAASGNQVCASCCSLVNRWHKILLFRNSFFRKTRVWVCLRWRAFPQVLSPDSERNLTLSSFSHSGRGVSAERAGRVGSIAVGSVRGRRGSHSRSAHTPVHQETPFP